MKDANPIKVVCITGCLGFMGSHFTRSCLRKGWMVWGIDKMTYAAHPDLLQSRCSTQFGLGPVVQASHDDKIEPPAVCLGR